MIIKRKVGTHKDNDDEWVCRLPCVINWLWITFFASLHLGWRNWSFCFCDIDSLNGNSLWHPPPWFFHSCISRHKWHFISQLFHPVASVMFTINYLGQSSVFCELIAIYVLLSFVERLKHRKVKIFTDNQSAARELSFGGFKVLQSVALSTFRVCFCMVWPWKCSGFLDC